MFCVMSLYSICYWLNHILHVYCTDSKGLNVLWFQCQCRMPGNKRWYYCDVIMGAMASQISNLTIVYLNVHSGADQRKHQNSVSPVTGEFPAQMASNAENVFIWLRYHGATSYSIARQSENYVHNSWGILNIISDIYRLIYRNPHKWMPNILFSIIRPYIMF